MQFLRNVWADLREKALWPIAVGLVLVLVAVPVFLGGGGSAPSDQASAPATSASRSVSDTTPDPNGVVVVGDTTPQPRPRGGKLHNPFVQPKIPVAKAPPTPGGASTGPAPAGGRGTGGAPNGGVTPTPTPTPAQPTPKPPTQAADPSDVYRVSLAFGQAGRQHAINDIPRLTPLPSKKNPFFVFLGVLKDGKTAVFLISSDVVATGDGKCRPSARDCQTIELQAGDTQFFDLTTADGQALQYQMDITAIRKVGATAAVARAAYALHSRDGQAVARAASDQVETQQVNAYHYRPADGVLVRAKPAQARTAATSGSPLRTFEFKPGEVAVFRSR